MVPTIKNNLKPKNWLLKNRNPEPKLKIYLITNAYYIKKI